MKTIGMALSVSLFALAIALPAQGMSDGDKCEVAKDKAAGKYYGCRLAAYAKGVSSGTIPDYTKCDDKLLAAWNKTEAHYGTDCPSSGDQAYVKGQETDAAAAIAYALHGGPRCGNGIVDVVTGEECDGTNLNGQKCSTKGFGGGVLTCTAGCSFDTSQCLPACGLPGSGFVSVGPYCWKLGDGGQSCDDVCTAAGLVYDAATAAYAGDGGTDAQCVAVMTAITQAVLPPISDGDCSTTVPVSDSGLGCSKFDYAWSVYPAYVRCTAPPTTSTAKFYTAGLGAVQRACACK